MFNSKFLIVAVFWIPLANAEDAVLAQKPDASATPPAAQQKPYIMGTETIAIPARPLPPRGAAFEDPVFGSTITRITDPSDGWGTTMRRHAYATFPPLNCNASLLLCEGEGPWRIYDLKACKYLRAIDEAVGDIGSPHWDVKDPNICYFAQTKGTALMKCDVSTGKVSVVHDFKNDFPEMKWLGYHSYDEPSADGRFWGFGIMDCKFWDERGAALAVVVYDMKEDKIAGKHAADAGAVVGISPSGKRITYSHRSWKPDFTDPVEMEPDTGHGDFAIDSNGREVFFAQNNKNDCFCMQDLETGKLTKLMSMIHGYTWEQLKAAAKDSGVTGMGYGMHGSGNCYATPGWAVVSTYGYKLKTPMWNEHCIYLLKLEEGDINKPVIWRVANTHGVWNPENPKHYWAETHASIDRYGKNIVFASNWDDPKAPIEDYCCQLPEGWYEQMMGAEQAKAVRAKAAATLGMSVEELTGKPASAKTEGAQP